MVHVYLIVSKVINLRQYQSLSWVIWSYEGTIGKEAQVDVYI